MITAEGTRTIYDLLQNAGAEHGDHIFLRWEDEDVVKEISYEDFCREAMGIAAWAETENASHSRNVHIALMGVCSKEYLTALLGIMANGNVVVPLDTQLNADSLAENLDKADVQVIIYDWEFHDLIKDALIRCRNMIRAICFQPREKKISYRQILESHIGSSVPPKATPSDLAMILYTSGTTGKGKGVMLSQGNLIDNVFCTTEERDLSNEVYLNVLPIHHVFCINGDVLMTLRYGYVLCLNRDLKKLLPHLQLFRPSFIRLVPMMAKTLANRTKVLQLQHPEKSIEECRELVFGDRIDRIMSGGGYLPPELARTYQDMGINIFQGYGMSECSPKITAPDWSRPDKVISVGRPVGGADVRIVDGEIRVKSPSVTMGYYNDPEETAALFDEDGYLCTGDLGRFDEEGFLHFTGRKKNLIVLTSGENVAPEEIENLFAQEPLVEDVVVYDDEDTIAAEFYPDFNYVDAKGIEEEALAAGIAAAVDRVNEKLPTFKRILRHSIRRHPFPKTASKKIMRHKFFEEKKTEKNRENIFRQPKTDLQSSLYEIICNNLGHRNLGVDTDIFSAGLDSMGSVMLLTDFYEQLSLSITLKDIQNHPTVVALEEFFKASKDRPRVDYSIRPVYPLSKMQMYFAYIMKGNTTSNLPFLFKLSPGVDLKKLKEAAEAVFEIHPELKAEIKLTEKGYACFRDDDRKIEIPIILMDSAEWEIKKEHIVEIFNYEPGDFLFHSAIYKITDTKENFFFFDLGHIMGDGMSVNVLFDDINRLYLGQKVEKLDYTFYEYILDEKEKEERGLRQENLSYFKALLRDSRIRKSILTLSQSEAPLVGDCQTLRSRFDRISHHRLASFCKTNGISENAVFLTIFGYCVALFAGEKDAVIASIHSGRTDSRWNRLTGPLFLNYPFRYRALGGESVIDLIKRGAAQILKTMDCYISTLRPDEMFIQYQGDILNIDTMGGEPAERQPITLTGLPFHLNIYTDDNGYYYGLRYWANRFDKDQLKVFMDCYEAMVNAVMDESATRRLRNHIPEYCIPLHYTIPAGQLWEAVGRRLVLGVPDGAPVRVYVLNDRFQKQPFGGWGDLYIADLKPETYADIIDSPYREGDLYMTNLTARIRPDRGLDVLDSCGRTVMMELMAGRAYPNLHRIEQVFAGHPDIDRADCYTEFSDEVVGFVVKARIYGRDSIDMEKLNAYLEENLDKSWLPREIIYGGPA